MSILLHNPSQVASSLTALSDAYGNRFDLCIGMGDRRQLGHVGINVEKTNTFPAKVLQAKRKIASHLHDAGVKAMIWLGAQGPRTLAIARSFDGVLLNYSRPEMISWAIKQMGVRRKCGLKIGTYSPSYVHQRLQPRLIRRVKVSSAIVAVGATSQVLKEFGLYEKLRKARKMAVASPTIEDILADVPDEVVKNFSITMKATNLPAYLVELRRLGVNHIVFAYPQNYSIETVMELGKALGSRFSG
jgi:alkanesulfonate monooxygenase SsuD/methylene tetrahydromethanopterin reductase-like flavin-dependent oxidoreductase (luciferase family)